jgi:ACDE family multidrug resistance protein
MISTVAALSALPQIVLGPVLGVAQDRYGRRAVLLPCLALWVLGAALQAAGLATGRWVFPLFVGGRLLQAMADSGFFQTALALIADAYQGDPRLGRAMALIESSGSAGGIAAPLLTAAVLPLGAWAPAAATGLLGLCLLLYLARTVPARRAVVHTVPLKAALPHLRHRQVVGTYLTGLLAMFTLQGVQTFLGFLLRDRYGLGTQAQGLLLAVVPWAMLAGALLTPLLQRRWPWQRLLPGSLFSSVLVFAVMALPLGWPLLTAGLAASGLLLGAILPLGNGVLAGRGDSSTRGVLMALFSSFRLLGSLAAPLLLGLTLPSGYTVTYAVAGVVAAGVSVAATPLLRAPAIEPDALPAAADD